MEASLFYFCSSNEFARDDASQGDGITYVVALWVACVDVGVTVTCTKYVVVYV